MTHLDELVSRYPRLTECRADIESAYRVLKACFAAGGTLLVCGNGGSASDAEHIVGELMKGFLLPRPVPEDLRARLREVDPVMGDALARTLQGALRAVNVSAGLALPTAFANDVSAEHAFAQAVHGLGRRGDMLMGISTSGNAANVRAALCVARASGMATIGLTGRGGGKMAALCDVIIRVPATRTFEVQELHLPVYHCLCAMVEERFFSRGMQ
jgi:D-sedoheptulose 7-phosphate isomerase